MNLSLMSSIFSECVDYVVKRGLDTKLFEAIITVMIGFITFKIYESYKNRHEYIELFIKLKQLEENINKCIINFESLLQEVKTMKKYQNTFSARYNNLYSVSEVIADFQNLQNTYLWRGQIQIAEDDYEVVEEYRSTPDILIDYYQQQVAADIELVGYYACSETIRELEELTNRTIYKDFEEMQEKYINSYDSDCEVVNTLRNIIGKIKIFNELERNKQNISLNVFCESIFDTNYIEVIKQKEKFENVEKRYLEINSNDYIQVDIQFEIDEFKFLVISDYNMYEKLSRLINELNNKREVPVALNELEDTIEFLQNDILKCVKVAVRKSQRKIKRFKWMA